MSSASIRNQRAHEAHQFHAYLPYLASTAPRPARLARPVFDGVQSQPVLPFAMTGIPSPLLDIDWAARWRSLVEQREAQAARLRDAARIMPPVYWERRAEGFHANVQRRAAEPDRLLELVTPWVTPASTVLDVGAGVGRHALPLAARAARVYAVEPSPAMRGYLEADAGERGLTNVTVVAATWSEAEVPACDVVLCSHVVYSVADIAGFVEKLIDHCHGACFIAVRTGQRDAQLLDLWQRVHREPKVPEPGFIELYNLLYQRFGIIANAEAVSFRGPSNPLGTFESAAAAAETVRDQLYVAAGSEGDRELRAYLDARLVVGADGGLLLPGPRVGAAILWWDNRPGSWNHRG